MFKILTNKASKAEDSSAWLPKTLVIGASPAVLEQVIPWRHHHVAFGVGLVGGVIIQHFIPPRGQPRVLAFLTALALALSLLNWYIF